MRLLGKCQRGGGAERGAKSGGESPLKSRSAGLKSIGVHVRIQNGMVGIEFPIRNPASLSGGSSGAGS